MLWCTDLTFDAHTLIPISLDSMIRSVHSLPRLARESVCPGDWILVRTVKSVYTLKVLGNGLYEVSGGWFTKKGLAFVRIGISGATWGGSAIMPGVLAACGMNIEFQNRLITSPVQRIVVMPHAWGN